MQKLPTTTIRMCTAEKEMQIWFTKTHLSLHFRHVMFLKLSIKHFIERGFRDICADHRVQSFSQLHAVPLADIRLFVVRVTPTIIWKIDQILVFPCFLSPNGQSSWYFRSPNITQSFLHFSAQNYFSSTTMVHLPEPLQMKPG